MAEDIQSPFSGKGPEAQFHAALKAGQFLLQECTGCGKYIFYPRATCPSCGSAKLQTKQASGNGVVYSASTVRRKPEAGGDFNISLIELEEGPRMMSWVVGIPAADVAIGAAVRAKISEIDGAPAVVFEKI
ncbi:MAG: OB-fold domain-containing protein [Paralcaligenes sp.]